jgi:hypothetical protein
MEIDRMKTIEELEAEIERLEMDNAEYQALVQYKGPGPTRTATRQLYLIALKMMNTFVTVLKENIDSMGPEKALEIADQEATYEGESFGLPRIDAVAVMVGVMACLDTEPRIIEVIDNHLTPKG